MGEKRINAHCDHCNKDVMGIGESPNHILHLLLTIFTAGFWLIIWILLTLITSSRPYRCTVCSHQLKLRGNKNPQKTQTVKLKKTSKLWWVLVVVFVMFIITVMSDTDEKESSKIEEESPVIAKVAEPAKKLEEKPKIQEYKLDFNISKVGGNQYKIDVSTNFPDNTSLLVSVSRLYTQKGKNEEYEGDIYQNDFLTKGGKLKVIINVADKFWIESYKDDFERFSGHGIFTGIDQISPGVEFQVMFHPRRQSKKVKKMLGDKGQFVSGPNVEKGRFNLIQILKKINLPVKKKQESDSEGKSNQPLDRAIAAAKSKIKPNDNLEIIYNKKSKTVFVNFKSKEKYETNYNNYWARWRDSELAIIKAFDKENINVGTVVVESYLGDGSGPIKNVASKESINKYAGLKEDKYWIRNTESFSLNKNGKWTKLE